MQQENGSWLNEKGQLVLLTAGVAGLLFIMFMVKHLINPMGYALVVGIVLYPMRKQPVARALLYGTGFTAGLWLTYNSGHLLIPFIIAFIIAFLVDPFVLRLEKWIPRWVTAILFTFIGFIVIGLFFFVASPAITSQFVKLSKLLITASGDTEAWLVDIGVTQLIDRLGLDSSVIVPQLAEQIQQINTMLYNSLTGASSKALGRTTNIIFYIIFFIILLPFLLFFMIRDYEKIGAFVKELVIPQNAPQDYTRELGRIIGGYLRGQFTVVIISMINLSLGFTLFGVPYGLLLGIFAGLTNFIPTFGLWIAVSVSTIVGATVGNPWYQFLPYIYLVFGLEQILETGFIVPRVVGKHVGLHPILVMMSLMIFGFMFGFLGLIIAVPTVALMSIFYQQYKDTGRISFLSGADLDTFLQQFEPEKKEHKS